MAPSLVNKVPRDIKWQEKGRNSVICNLHVVRLEGLGDQDIILNKIVLHNKPTSTQLEKERGEASPSLMAIG